jgi:hypothetical protein
MIPCGTCLYNALTSHSKSRNHQDSFSSTTTAAAAWYEQCGNYQVYSNFHVESVDPYTFFLPQHYTLPYLLSSTSSTSSSSSSSSTATATTATTANTIWILNQRSSSAIWATNILHWFSITNRILNSFQIPYYYHDTENDDKDDDDESTSTATTPTVHLSTKQTVHTLMEELDTSFERLHNQTDHQRRFVEVQAIYEYHARKIQQFVHEYNAAQSIDNDNNNNRNKQAIQLYEVNVDDSTTAPFQLARALGFVSSSPEVDGNKSNDPTTATTMTDNSILQQLQRQIIQDCWTYQSSDEDYRDFNLSTTFRASV